MHICLKLDFMVTFDLFMLWIEIMLFLPQHGFIIPDGFIPVVRQPTSPTTQ